MVEQLGQPAVYSGPRKSEVLDEELRASAKDGEETLCPCRSRTRDALSFLNRADHAAAADSFVHRHESAPSGPEQFPAGPQALFKRFGRVSVIIFISILEVARRGPLRLDTPATKKQVLPSRSRASMRGGARGSQGRASTAAALRAIRRISDLVRSKSRWRTVKKRERGNVRKKRRKVVSCCCRRRPYTMWPTASGKATRASIRRIRNRERRRARAVRCHGGRRQRAESDGANPSIASADRAERSARATSKRYEK